MNLSSNISDRIKDSSLDTKKLIELIKAGVGPTIHQIAAFQESLWNDAFEYEPSSDTEAPRCTRQESDERWMSIIYLFFDLIEHRDEREQDYIRLTSQDGIFCSSSTGTGNSLPSYIYISLPLSHPPYLSSFSRYPPISLLAPSLKSHSSVLFMSTYSLEIPSDTVEVIPQHVVADTILSENRRKSGRGMRKISAANTPGHVGLRRDFMNSQESSALVRMTAASDQIVTETMVAI